MNSTVRARGAMLFEAVGLSRRFDDGTEALADVSLTARTGGFVAILGPSGCGKSTLLRILASLDGATAGRVDWCDGPPAKGDIAFVFQEPTLLPWSSLWDNIYLPLRLAGRSRAEARSAVDDSIRLVGLDGFAQSRPGQLSGGMKMRASVARALVTGPSLLLMDEPFAALDEITRFRLNDDLLRVWTAQRCTVLFVTHSVFEAVYLAERVIVMSPRPGRIVGEVAIDLPYPRQAALRTELAYAALCRRVSDLLAETAS
jgi:NitT/TauT family transport system ATP-binding protein